MKLINKIMFLSIAACSMTMQAASADKFITQVILGVVIVCGGTWICAESNDSLIEKADADLQNLDTCQDFAEEQPSHNKTQEQIFQEYLQKKFKVQTSQIKKGTNVNSRMMHAHIDRMRSKLSDAKQHLEFRQSYVPGLFASSVHRKYSEIKRLYDALNRVDSFKTKSLEQFLLGHQIVNEHKDLLSLLTNKQQFVGSVYRKYFTQSQSPLKAYMNQIALDINAIDELLQGANYREEFPELRKKLEDSRKNLVNAFDTIQASKEYKEEQNAQFKKDQAQIEQRKLSILEQDAQAKRDVELRKARAVEIEAQAKAKDADTNRQALDYQRQQDRVRREREEDAEERERQARLRNPQRNAGQGNIPVARAVPAFDGN